MRGIFEKFHPSPIIAPKPPPPGLNFALSTPTAPLTQLPTPASLPPKKNSPASQLHQKPIISSWKQLRHPHRTPDTASPAAAATSVQPEPAPAPLPDTAPSSPPPTRRHYTLWELVRHEDHDRPAPQSDPHRLRPRINASERMAD